MTSAPPFTATLAMATFRRPHHVRRIVPLLLKEAAAAPVPVRVVVVDNDPDGTARPLVEGTGAAYVHEPEPGIAAARNAALDAAAGDDVIVFVDDDEEPADGWLATLLEAWAGWRCAGVAGPVESRFDGEPDPWVLASGLFDTVRRPTGAILPGAATNNLLLDLNTLRRHGIRFDSRFGLSGGSDTMLTHSLIAAGEQLRWCAEALVHDLIPADRSTPAWVRNRVRRQANSWTRVKLETGSRRPWLIAQAVKLMLLGSIRWVRGDRARGVCDVLRGVGVLNGVTGSIRSEYLR
jgi:glycosyltransferase involved in cell wall biosynthesis